ncbi:MAG TPA: PepSY-associated TM helix domain-containing protein [Gemmatimonas sp.]|nr:PepSY-associated TM helix domain-containing protein [Gemmatimonas sp.]
MTLRKLLFWTHLAVGAVAGLVILLMSVTGALLTYQKQITAWADRGYRVEVPAGGQRAPVAALLASASAATPDARPTSLVVRQDSRAPASIALGRGRTLFLDPYTAAALGEGSTRVRTFFRVNTDLHRWLAMKDKPRETARLVTGVSNLAFLFLVLSGLVLWVPRRWTWTQTRAVLLPRRGLRGKARDYNWHHVLGLWFAIPLVMIVASGVVISFPWASALVYRVVGEKPPTASPAAAGAAVATSAANARATTLAGKTTTPAPLLAGLDGSIDALLARATAHTTDWRTVTLQLPIKSAEKVSFAIDAGNGGQPQLRQTLVLDGATAAVLSNERFADGTRGRQLRSILRFTHTGEVLGVPGQTVAGLASLAGAILVWTGLALSFRRLAAWLRRGRAAKYAVELTNGETSAVGGAVPRGEFAYSERLRLRSVSNPSG